MMFILHNTYTPGLYTINNLMALSEQIELIITLSTHTVVDQY